MGSRVCCRKPWRGQYPVSICGYQDARFGTHLSCVWVPQHVTITGPAARIASDEGDVCTLSTRGSDIYKMLQHHIFPSTL